MFLLYTSKECHSYLKLLGLKELKKLCSPLPTRMDADGTRPLIGTPSLGQREQLDQRDH